MPILQAASVSRSFGRHQAVRDVSFALEAGDTLALFGPNGAGKTTLLRILAGLLRPTAGKAFISGTDVLTETTTRGRIGLISHQTMLYPALTAAENVEFAARLHGVPSPRTAALAALDRLGIAQRAGSPVKILSRGMQQRVSIARAIVHDPAVVLLDEPYTGLDASGASALSALLLSLRERGAAMVLVTHNIEEGLAISSQAAVMVRGSFVDSSRTDIVTPSDFARKYRSLTGVQETSAA
jgi:heme exporter protein A